MSVGEKRNFTGFAAAAAVATALFHFGVPQVAAMELAAPFSPENTAVLPQGVRSPQYIGISTLLDQRFSGDGGKIPLADPINKPVGWADVIANETDSSQQNLVKALLHGKPAIPGHAAEAEILVNGNAGQATGDVNIRATVQVPAFAFGITDSWTLAIAVPIVRAQISADTGFSTSPDGQTIIDRICAVSPDKCNESARKLNDPVTQKLRRLGYQAIESETISGMGDIQVISKHLIHRDDNSGLALKGVLTLPTGTAPDPDKALDLTTGDNRFQVGAELIYEHSLLGSLGTTFYTSYTALLPNSMTKRLPTSSFDSLSNDKQDLTRELGHLVAVGAALNYKWDKAGLMVSSGYSFQSLSRAEYSGPSVDAATEYRYYLLGDLEPDQLLHAIVTAVGFSTVDWYLKNKFFLPFQLSLTYSHPFAGRNAPTGDVFAGQAVLFF